MPILALLCFILLGCSSPSTSETPWEGASFIDPALTRITFKNGGPETRNLDADVRWYHTDIDLLLADSLANGDSSSVVLQIHRPRYLFLRSGGHESLRLLLPGMDRVFFHGDTAVQEAGPHASLYRYFDEVLLPINPVGRPAPAINDMVVFQEDFLKNARWHHDTIPVPKNLPAFVGSLLDKILQLESYHTAIQMRFYYAFFYQDTLEIPPLFTDSLDILLANQSMYDTPRYTEVFNSISIFKGEKDFDPKATGMTNNMQAIATAHQASFPLPLRQNDAIATYLASLLLDPRLYSGKVEHIESLRSSLPENYRSAIREMEQRAIDQAASDEGLADFLAVPLENLDGEQRAIGNKGDKLRLLKFWFAGCYPCLIQQPFEQQFLRDHPDVEMIYVAHSTKSKEWHKYVADHTPPANRHFRVTRKQMKHLMAAAGTTGAPTYVLIDGDGKSICRPCPKPDDSLLSEIIGKSR